MAEQQHQLPCNQHELRGRRAELNAVLEGLSNKLCVVVSRSPGEGKSALACKAVESLVLDAKAVNGGVYLVNLKSDSQSCPCLTQCIYSWGCLVYTQSFQSFA